MSRQPTDSWQADRVSKLNRRNFVQVLGGVGAAGLAGCLGGSSDDSAEGGNGDGDGDGDSGGGGSTAGGNGDSAPTRPIDVESIPPESFGDTVNVFNWYYTWRDWATAEFADETDITVNTPDFARAADVYASFEAGNHEVDNVSLTTAWSSRAMNNDFLEPLPVDVMESWAEVPEFVKETTREYKSMDGDIYAVPQTVGVARALTYNTEVFDSTPDSWDVLWDDAYEGQIVMEDSAKYSCQIAAWYTDQDPYDPDDFDEIEEVLIQQKPLLNTYWSGYNQSRQLFINDEAVVGPLLDGQTFLARFEEGAPIDYTVPSEGALLNVDDIVIPKGAPNPMASLYFVDWALRPQQSKQLLLQMGYRPPVTEDQLDEMFAPELESGELTQEQVDFYKYPDEWNDRLRFNAPLDEEVRERYDEIWTTVKAA